MTESNRIFRHASEVACFTSLQLGVRWFWFDNLLAMLEGGLGDDAM
jgi:hypothetical protein